MRCVCPSMSSSQTKTSNPVVMEQGRACLLTSALIQTESRKDILSYGSTAAIHRKGGIRFLVIKILFSTLEFQLPITIKSLFIYHSKVVQRCDLVTAEMFVQPENAGAIMHVNTGAFQISINVWILKD